GAVGITRRAARLRFSHPESWSLAWPPRRSGRVCRFSSIVERPSPWPLRPVGRVRGPTRWISDGFQPTELAVSLVSLNSLSRPPYRRRRRNWTRARVDLAGDAGAAQEPPDHRLLTGSTDKRSVCRRLRTGNDARGLQ